MENTRSNQESEAAMNLQEVYCDNPACVDKYQSGKGNIVCHDRKRQRCKCKRCGQTFAYRRGTLYAGLRTDEQLVTWVVALVAYGCPIAAIVAVFGLDVRTVRAWLRRAGEHMEVFHRQQMQPLDLVQVQVDEMRLKAQGQVLWLAMAIAVGSRLWLGAVCGAKRDRRLARQIITCVYNWAKACPLLIAFDGWNAYPGACLKVFREAVYTGQRGAPRQQVWQHLTLVQVVKSTTRQSWSRSCYVVYGSCTMLVRLLACSQGSGSINTAYIERLNATFRSRLAILTRRTRHLARQMDTVQAHVYLLGCVYNFCTPHASLGQQHTPAMVAGLTDHCWTISDLLHARLKPFWASTV